ncbi:MAG TPA: 6,7-dimethyl-8-ribityllumazine synthase, partial [Solirubrobacterales bacterium]|nr:6,7-dimethyl-8-ribityllumazine synthase [Solirubrobacterales bacterium]
MNEDRAAEVRVALIQSSWHKDLVDRIATGFIAEAGELGHPESSIEIVNVTGAFGEGYYYYDKEVIGIRDHHHCTLDTLDAYLENKEKYLWEQALPAKYADFA